MKEKSIEEQIFSKAQAAKRLARYMSSTADLVENQIEKARSKGAFDNLPGAGKPLNIEENPYVDPEMRMALKILKDNDFAPYWIELGKEIEADWIEIRRKTDYFKRSAKQTLSKDIIAAKKERFEKRKELFYHEIREKINATHMKIIDYNLHCPTYKQGRSNINPEFEIEKLIKEIEEAVNNSLNNK